jgi:two-component system cell cycle sensor histidine kinase/response regulator CckA
MMEVAFVLGISTLLQIAAALLALRLIRVTGRQPAWVLIATAVSLMAVWRCITLFRLISGDLAHPPDLSAELVALATSTLMVTGIALIAPLFLSTRHSEETPQTSEAKYRELVQNANSIILRLDTQGRITFLNEFAQSFFGYTKDEILGQNIIGRIVPERETSGRDLTSMIEDIVRYPEQYINNENENMRRNGERVWVAWTNKAILDGNGHVTEILCIGNDITERVQAQEALQESEERLRNLVENMPIVCFTFDQQGRILSWNRAAERVYGYTKDEAIGANSYDLIVTPMTKEATDRVIQKVFAGKRVEGSEWQDRDKQGQIGWRIGNTFPLLNADGSVDCGVNLNIDITERKRLEEQFRQAQKMEAVGLLAGGIAHDFNNLLTAINGFARLIQSRLAPDDPCYELTGKILGAGQRAADLVRQLLTFSRKQVIEPRVLDLNDAVVNMDKMLRRVIGEDIELETFPAPDLWPVKVDPTQIEQVIVNLAVNARDAMSYGGTLIIETANVTLDQDYAHQHAEATPGEHVLLAISDTGIGMSGEVQAHIFEPFFTTKEVGKGTGLGLATVYGVVKQSGGHIQVHSEEGDGTTFKIYLPRAEEVVAPLPQYDHQAGVVPRGTETVLLVEDAPAVRDMTARVLRQQGYTVLEAGNGEEALRQAQEHPGDIHLLLTDVVMPRISGKALADRMSTICPEAKVLFTSGYTGNVILHQGAPGPSTPFIQKPFSPEKLAHKVREVLDGRR